MQRRRHRKGTVARALLLLLWETLKGHHEEVGEVIRLGIAASR